MKKFMVIGIGNFGFYLAKTLYEKGNEVVVIDKTKEQVEKIRDYCSKAIISDAQSKEFLEMIGTSEMDAVIVSLGGNISQSLLTTMYLKELKTKYILVKINDPDHARALTKIGADKVIYPDRDMGTKVAQTLASPSILDSFSLSPEYVVAEVLTPLEFAGQSLIELELRQKYGVFVIAIKQSVPDNLDILPEPGYRLKDSDSLLCLGKAEDIEKISNMTKE